MRELDQLLQARLDALLAAGDEAALKRFDRLLATEDDRLWRWCLGHEAPPDPDMRAEIDAIRARHTA